MLADTYGIILDHGVGTPGTDLDVVDDLNATVKRFISMLTENVKFSYFKVYDNQLIIQNTTKKTAGPKKKIKNTCRIQHKIRLL